MPRSDGEKMAAKWSKLDPQTNNRTLYYAIAIVAILAIIAIVAVAVFALTQDNTTGAEDSQTPKPIQDIDGEIYHNIKVLSRHNPNVKNRLQLLDTEVFKLFLILIQR